MPLRRIYLTIIVAMILAISGAFQAEAFMDYTWNGAYSNDWTDFSNWDGTVYPDGSDAAAIINSFGSVGFTVDLGAFVTVGKLEIGTTDSLTLYGPSDLSLVKLDGATEPIVTNDGEIQLSGSASAASLTANAAFATLTGSGSLVLVDDSNSMLLANADGEFFNDANHTIRGTGIINAPLTNDGTVLADAGVIQLLGHVDNTDGILGASSPGRLIIFDSVDGGSIDPGDGVVELKSGETYYATIEDGDVEVTSMPVFKGVNTNHATILISDGGSVAPHELSFDDFLGAPTLTNHGVIELQSPNGNVQSLSSPSSTLRTTLTGTGKVLLGVLDRCRITGLAGFINDYDHTIEGAGDIAAPIENRGLIRAVNGTLEIQAPITGDGQIIVDNGTLNIALANVETYEFTMLPPAVLTVGPGRSLDVDGNFIFEQTNEGNWSWAAGSTLRMSPGMTKYLEVGGVDRGAAGAGFSNNFNLENLVIQSAGTRVILMDSLDNGNRTSPEALYANTLQVLPGATLDLDGIHLYTHKDGAPYLVKQGDGPLFGGGVIEDSGLCMYAMAITIPSDGGSVVDNVGVTCPTDCNREYVENTTVPFTAVPHSGWEFVRWDGDLNGAEENPVEITWISDMEVEAVFAEAPTWKLEVVAPNPAEGSVSGPGIGCPQICLATFDDNEVVSLTANPAAGYEFVAWGGDLAGVTNNPANITMVANKKVYAEFAPAPLKVTLTVSAAPAGGGAVTGSGIACPGDCDQAFDPGTATTLTAAPSPGNVFVRWDGDLAGAVDNPVDVTMDADKNVTAVFAPAPASVTLTTIISPAGGGAVAGSGINCPGDCEETFDPGAVATLTAAPSPGYAFLRWDGDLAGVADNPADVIMNADKNITAVFAPVGVDRTLETEVSPADGGVVTGSGIDCPDDCAAIFSDGARVELAATPSDGFLFSHWTGDLDGPDNPAALVMDADKSVTAVFVPIRCALEAAISPEEGGSVKGDAIDCPDDCAGEYDAGTEVDLLAIPARGFRFDHWEGALQGSSNTASLVMDGDKNVVAVFVPVTHTLTLSISPDRGGVISSPRGKCPANCKQIYAVDALAALEAAAAPGYLFSHWELDLTGSDISAELLMDSDKRVRAVFIVNEGNLPPEEPEGLFPWDNAFLEGLSVTLKAGPFVDPENDEHVLTRWKIRRADMGYGRSYYDPSFDHAAEAGDGLTEHTVTGLQPCLKYVWKVGYMDFGSGRITWSREYAFFIDASEVTEEMLIQGGIEDEDFTMVSFGVWPLDPSSEHVFGDDMIGPYGEDYLIGAYNPLLGGYEQFGPHLKVIPGRAYWILTRHLFRVTVTGTPSCLDSVIETPLLYSNGDGWNQIGVPASRDYPWREVRVIVYDDNGGVLFGPVAISELPEDNPYIDARLWGFTNRGYEEVLIMRRNVGYWAKARQANVALLYHTLFIWSPSPRDGERWERNDGQGETRTKKWTVVSPDAPPGPADLPPGPPRPGD